MKVTIESTTQLTEVNGVPGRVWQGRTESGIPVVCIIARVVVHKDADCSQFEQELHECVPPGPMAIEAIPNRMVL